MAHRHLTDREIQNYLDGNSLENSLINHQETCSVCRNSIKQYQNLYEELKTDPGFQLPKDFAESVVSKLPASKSFFSFAEIVVILTGVLMALGTTIYFVGWKPFEEILSSLILTSIEIKSIFIVPVKNLISSLNHNLNLLVFAGAVLLVIAAIDQAILKLKYRNGMMEYWNNGITE